MKANNRDVQRISNLAKGYERNLCGKDFLICYGEEGNTRMLEVTFSKKRFNHLVGIDIGRCHIKPWVLYKKALAGTLTVARLGKFAFAVFPHQSPRGTHDECLCKLRHPCQQGQSPIYPSQRRDLDIGRCGTIRHRVSKGKCRVPQLVLLCAEQPAAPETRKGGHEVQR